MRVLYGLGAVAAALALTTAASADAVVTNGLMAYYSFDNSSNLGADTSGNDFSGTPTGTVAYTAAAKSGGAAVFTNSGTTLNAQNEVVSAGMATDYIVLPGSTMNSSGMNAFSFSCWLKPSFARQVDGWMPISAWSKNTTDGTANAASTQFRLYPEPSAQLRIRNDYVPKTTLIDQKITEYPPTKDTWTHYAFSYDSVKGSTLYINGTHVYTSTIVQPTDAGTTLMGNWNYAAWLGAAPNDISNGFCGTMDEVYMFNRVITGDEVKQLADVPEPSSIVLLIVAGISSLLLWWRKR